MSIQLRDYIFAKFFAALGCPIIRLQIQVEYGEVGVLVANSFFPTAAESQWTRVGWGRDSMYSLYFFFLLRSLFPSNSTPLLPLSTSLFSLLFCHPPHSHPSCCRSWICPSEREWRYGTYYVAISPNAPPSKHLYYHLRWETIGSPSPPFPSSLIYFVEVFMDFSVDCGWCIDVCNCSLASPYCDPLPPPIVTPTVNDSWTLLEDSRPYNFTLDGYEFKVTSLFLSTI